MQLQQRRVRAIPMLQSNAIARRATMGSRAVAAQRAISQKNTPLRFLILFNSSQVLVSTRQASVSFVTRYQVLCVPILYPRIHTVLCVPYSTSVYYKYIRYIISVVGHRTPLCILYISYSGQYVCPCIFMIYSTVMDCMSMYVCFVKISLMPVHLCT